MFQNLGLEVMFFHLRASFIFHAVLKIATTSKTQKHAS